MGHPIEIMGHSQERGPPSGEGSPAHTPPPKDQDKGRLQMLLEGALAAKSNQGTKAEDPKDKRYNQLLEEMRRAEGIFAHSLKEIEMRDRRILRLEDDLGRREERNKLLRGQLELAHGRYRDPLHLGEPTPGHCGQGQGPQPVDNLPIVISFRACKTLTSFFPNAGNIIDMLQCKQSGAGSTLLD